MAFIFNDESHPESSEYQSNYFYFDEKEPGALALMMRKCVELGQHITSSNQDYFFIEDNVTRRLFA